MGVVQLPSGVNVGGLGKRCAAQVIDGVIPVVLGSVWASVAATSPTFEALLVVSIACGVLGLAYALLLWWMFAARAAGPGMRLMKLQLVGVADGAPIGWGRFFLRQLVLVACAATGIGLVVVVVLLILHPLHQGWHDLAARSVVIAERVKPQVTTRTPSTRRPVSSMSVSSTVGLPPHLATQPGFAGQHDSWDAVSSGAFGSDVPAASGPITSVPGYAQGGGQIVGVPTALPQSGTSAADAASWGRPSEGRPPSMAERSPEPWGAAPAVSAGSPFSPAPVMVPPATPSPVAHPPAAAPPSLSPPAARPPVGAPPATAAPDVAGPPRPGDPGVWGAPRQPAPASSWESSPAAPSAARGLEPPPWGAPAGTSAVAPPGEAGWAPGVQPARAWGVPETSVPPASDELTDSLPVRAVSPGVTAVPAAPVDDDGRTHLARPVVRTAGAWALRLDDGREIVLSGTVLIGRNPVARGGEDVSDLISVGADGRMVSKTHLAVGVDQRGVYVVDRGSTNGTAIATSGGIFEPCAAGDRVRVRDGQVISFGDHSLVVHRTQG
jgi:uncharacterized RDD family membrane protein YckC